MSHSEPAPFRRYGVAILSFVVATIATLAIESLRAVDPPVLLFLASVIFSAWYGGVGPSLVVTFLSLLTIDFLFIPPIFAIVFDWGDTIRLGGFVVVALLASAIEASRRRALAVLQASEERVQSIVDHVLDGIITIDETGTVETFNPAAERVFGFHSSEVIGNNIKMLMPAPYHGEHDGYLTNYLATGNAKIIGIGREVVGRRKDGTTFPMDLAVSEFSLGDHRYFTGIVRDISDRKRAETALRETAEELARSNLDLEQFAYVASHDLQEPLRAVAGCAQVLARRYEGKLDDRADELIAHTVDGVSRMQGLINDLLAYSRIGTRGAAFETTDVGFALDRAVANLEAAIAESEAVVARDELPVVQADASQLTQLFQNLVGNAIKFRGAQTPRIHVGAHRTNGTWVLSVRDNGIGLEAEYFDRIFVIFQRLHTRAEYPGTGIGLAVCKKIVERHGGKIWVESEPGRGTTFFFTIPSKRGESDESGQYAYSG
jgi:PAS domain S-box-containing protein